MIILRGGSTRSVRAFAGSAEKLSVPTTTLEMFRRWFSLELTA
jgi:hypothetical protein